MKNAWIVGLLGIFVALGCGSSEEEAAAPAATAAPVKIGDTPKNPEVVAAKRAAANAGAQIKQGELPEGFPTDLPVFPDSQPKTSMMVGSSGLVVLSSPASIADVVAHYREELPSQGWTVDAVTESASGTKATIRAHKDSRQTTVSINQAQGGSGTEIGISLKGSS